MSSSFNLSLTDELQAFVDQHCGEGTLFTTPDEFVRAVLREKKDREEAAAIRDAVLEGYEDLLQGRTQVFRGTIRQTIQNAIDGGMEIEG